MRRLAETVEFRYISQVRTWGEPGPDKDVIWMQQDSHRHDWNEKYPKKG
jgi:hypothetical protein